MIEFLVCGLMMYYHVDCIQFYFYEERPVGLDVRKGSTWWIWNADSQYAGKIGIIHIYENNPIMRDKCGNTILEHELQRFHQQRWDFNFCNV